MMPLISIWQDRSAEQRELLRAEDAGNGRELTWAGRPEKTFLNT